MKSKEREIEILMAVYVFDMKKLADKMQSITEYIPLAELYEESAKLIRKLDKDMKDIEDGSK